MNLHLGCGSYFIEGWINVDYSLGAKVASIPILGSLVKALNLFHIDWDPRIDLHNLAEPLPWADSSVECIYTSHTLAHLRREDGERLMIECYRVLKPGGVLRIVVPDLRSSVDDYLDGKVPCERFVESLLVLKSKGANLKHKILGMVDEGHLAQVSSTLPETRIAVPSLECFPHMRRPHLPLSISEPRKLTLKQWIVSSPSLTMQVGQFG